MGGEPLIELVAPGHEHRRRGVARTSGATGLLAERRDGAGEAVDHHGVESTDIDAELERGRGDHPGELTREQLVLDGSSLFGEVATAIGAHARPESGGKAPANVGGDDLHAPSAPREGQRGAAAVDEPGDQRRRLAMRRATGAGVRVEQRWLPQRQRARTARRSVGEHRVHLVAADGAGQPLGRADRRRGADEHRIGTMVDGEPAQPASELGDVAAEDAAEGVQLVEHDEAKPPEEGRPTLMVRQQPGVQHLGVGEHDRCVLANPGALLGAGVAVVGAGHHPRELEGGERAELVVSQRLGGEHGERGARADGVAGRLRDGHLVAERLPRRGARRDDHRVAGAGRLDRFDLVRPERPGQSLGDGVGQRAGELGVPRRPSWLRVEEHEAAGSEVGGGAVVGVVGAIALGGQVAEHVGDGRTRAGAELEGSESVRADGHARRRAYADPAADDRAVVPAV